MTSKKKGTRIMETSFIGRDVDAVPPPASGSFRWSSTSYRTTFNHHQEHLELTSNKISQGHFTILHMGKN
jgi:hypothetical protein